MPTGHLAPSAPAAGAAVTPATLITRAPRPVPDNWAHYTLDPAELASGAEALIQTTGGTRIKILELDGIKLWVRFDQTVTSTPGHYDLVHPGAGELDESVLPFQVVHIIAASNPTRPLEIIVLDGLYANRPN